MFFKTISFAIMRNYIKYVLSLLTFVPILTLAQTNYQGVKFENGLSWEQVKALAKTKNRYIFIDCYTPWCLPCKKMDTEIYPNDTVGSYMNQKFVSIKVQMDTSKYMKDSSSNWRSVASYFETAYKVYYYPTYLFFSPDGKIVHKGGGVKNVKDFIALATDATNPQKQYFTLLEKYSKGQLPPADMKRLALLTMSFSDQELATKIADSYLKIVRKNIFDAKDGMEFLEQFTESPYAQKLVNTYISGLADTDLYNKDKIQLMANYAKHSKDPIFHIFLKQGNQIDAAIGQKGFSENVVDGIITKEDINPKLPSSKSGSEPNWDQIIASVKQKYGDVFADRAVLKAKIRWYYDKDKQQFIKLAIQRVEKYPSDTITWLYDGALLNNYAWEIFLYSTDKVQLGKAIEWMEGAVRRHGAELPETMDTYAHLLYKTGRTQEAVSWEEKALKVATEQKNSDQMKRFNETVIKMKNGETTRE